MSYIFVFVPILENILIVNLGYKVTKSVIRSYKRLKSILIGYYNILLSLILSW